MKITLTAATENAKLKLTVDTDRPLSATEWDAISAQLKAWEPSAVSEGTRTVNRLLAELQEPDRTVNGLPVRNCPKKHTHATHSWGEIQGTAPTFGEETPTEHFWCMGDE